MKGHAFIKLAKSPAFSVLGSILLVICLAAPPAKGQSGTYRPTQQRAPQAPSGQSKPATKAQQARHLYDMVSSYKAKTVGETLAKLQALIEKPPAKYDTAQVMLAEHLNVPRNQLAGLSTSLAKMKTGKPPMLSGFIEKQLKAWQLIEQWALKALKFNVGLKKHQSTIKKATEDAPKKLKAMGEEFAAIKKRMGDFLKGIGKGVDRSKAQRTGSFVTTTADNVFKVMGEIVSAYEKLAKTKLNDPEHVKKQSKKLRKAGNGILESFQADPQLNDLFSEKWKLIVAATKKNESQTLKMLKKLQETGKIPDYRDAMKKIEDQLEAAAAKIPEEDIEFFRTLVEGWNQQMGNGKKDVIRRVISLEQVTGKTFIVWGKYGL